MRHIQQLVGFPVYRDFRFALFGRKYRLGASGIKALKLLEDAYLCSRNRADGSWPFRLRAIVRKIRNIDAKSTLCFVVANTDNPTVRILAIWLRGHCGGTIGTQVLGEFSRNADDQTRKEIARALKRMSAWKTLSNLSKDPNPRVARMASCKSPESFATKFGRFASSVSAVDVSKSSKQLLLGPEVELDRQFHQPPKSAAFIRSILLRIKNLLSANDSYRNAG